MFRPHSSSARPPVLGEVVAGLVEGPLARAVAAATVGDAVTRNARIRFLQVLPTGLGAAAHTEAASVLFRIAMTALAGGGMLPVTFETVVGTAPQMLVDRSRGALLLIVGADAPDARPAVASYCMEHCGCDVLVVSEPLLSGSVGNPALAS